VIVEGPDVMVSGLAMQPLVIPQVLLSAMI
jgi:hypothetical protein